MHLWKIAPMKARGILTVFSAPIFGKPLIVRIFHSYLVQVTPMRILKIAMASLRGKRLLLG